MDTRAFFFPDQSINGKQTLLNQPISAIELVRTAGGSARLGLLSQLQTGTVVEWCGSGFNDRTVKVTTERRCYFVFAEDLKDQDRISKGALSRAAQRIA